MSKFQLCKPDLLCKWASMTSYLILYKVIEQVQVDFGS